MKRLEPARQLAVREHTRRSLRRALTLAMVDHLEQVAATLRQAPDVNTYMVAAAALARLLVLLSLGAHQLGRPLPPAVIDAIPELHRWAAGVKAQARVADPCGIRPSEPDSYPQTAPKRGSPEVGSEQSSLASGAPAQSYGIGACGGVAVALTSHSHG